MADEVCWLDCEVDQTRSLRPRRSNMKIVGNEWKVHPRDRVDGTI